MTLIYMLVDSDSGRIGYIGKTVGSLRKRLQAHLLDNSKTHKVFWIKSLQTAPTIKVIESCDNSVWQDRERFWISHYRRLGEKLTNSTDGGDGPDVYDATTRSKISKSLKGRRCPCSNSRAIAISIAKKGRGNGREGKPMSDATKKKIALANTGRISPNKGIKQSPELIAKRVASRIKNGHRPTHEWCLKNSENHPFNKPVFDKFSGITYRSIAFASRCLGIPESNIRFTLGKGRFERP